jgi:hypothetical protein
MESLAGEGSVGGPGPEEVGSEQGDEEAQAQDEDKSCENEGNRADGRFGHRHSHSHELFFVQWGYLPLEEEWEQNIQFSLFILVLIQIRVGFCFT